MGGHDGLGLNIGLTVACDKMINDWFIKRRGLAQEVKFALVGLFGIVVLQVIHPLEHRLRLEIHLSFLGHYHIRQCSVRFFPGKARRPEYYGLLPDGATFDFTTEDKAMTMIDRGIDYATNLEETEYTFREAIKTGALWLLVIGFSTQYFIAGGF